MPREFKYRGYTANDLINMPYDQLFQILPSRARRSLNRLGAEMNPGKKVLFEKLKQQRETTKTHDRDTVILPFMIGKKISVYTGKEFIQIEIKPEMIGHYIGEYVSPIKKVVHGTPGIGASRSSLYVPLK